MLMPDHEIIFFRYSPVTQTMKQLTSHHKFMASGILTSDYLWLNNNTLLLPCSENWFKHSLKTVTIKEDRLVIRSIKVDNTKHESTTAAAATTATTTEDVVTSSGTDETDERIKLRKLQFAGTI